MAEKKQEIKENILNAACLVGGKPFSRGENADFDDEVVADLRAAGRICKTKEEADNAKKSLVAAKKSLAAAKKASATDKKEPATTE